MEKEITLDTLHQEGYLEKNDVKFGHASYGIEYSILNGGPVETPYGELSYSSPAGGDAHRYKSPVLSLDGKVLEYW